MVEHFPYSEPTDDSLLAARSDSVGVKLSGRAWVAITAMICGTVLLLCGGVIGLGFYAVDRLAEQMVFDDDWMPTDEEATLEAIEYAIAEDTTTNETVGQIQSVTFDDELTYDDAADPLDYFYRVVGDSGEMTVVAQFSDDETRWFDKVERLDGREVHSPRTPLSFRPVPFKGRYAQTVFEILDSDASAMEILGTGKIKRITDSEIESELPSHHHWRLKIIGEERERELLIEYQSDSFENVVRIDVLYDDGSTETVWAATESTDKTKS